MSFASSLIIELFHLLNMAKDTISGCEHFLALRLVQRGKKICSKIVATLLIAKDQQIHKLITSINNI